jgi:hypothetical protein
MEYEVLSTECGMRNAEWTDEWVVDGGWGKTVTRAEGQAAELAIHVTPTWLGLARATVLAWTASGSSVAGG